MIKYPKLLQKGDRIGIVATGRKINSSDLELAVQVFETWGLEAVLSKNIQSKHHGYLAGSEEERAEDLQSMINDKNIRAIICARGGYGTTQILDDIDLSPLQKDPKWIVGFSDITALHLALLKNGIASVHGTMPVLFSNPRSAPSLESLGKLLMMGECRMETTSTKFNRHGEASGIMVGGNLSLIADALGTATEPDTDDKILFIEEVDEYLYKVDRMMTQLRRAGKLKNLKALVVGQMTDIKDTDLTYGELFQEIILRTVRQYNYPVAFNFPSGHDHPNHAWVHGGKAHLVVNEQSSVLRFENLKRHTV